MILKNDENEIVLNTESLHLYDVTASIEVKSTIIVNGKQMTVKEFREMKKSDPKEGLWGKKAMNEMDNEFN